MHDSALRHMDKMLTYVKSRKKSPLVLDVGSRDVNGTYRPLVEGRGWTYTGLDIEAGPNVDIVAADPFRYPFEANTFDVVISGSTMEHVTAIWRWVPELARVLRPRGLLCIVTHWQEVYHAYPVDCWRIMPDGMQFLLDEAECFEDVDIKMHAGGDLAARARKVKG